jgi:hypothetical protein
VWNVVWADGELRLSSLLYRELWTPGSAHPARCRRTLAALPWGRLPLHDAPNVECRCGIYAVQTPSAALAYLTSEARTGERPPQRVIGTVALWGRIVEADRGWRAEFAYPVTLFVPAGWWRRLAAAALWPYRPSPAAIAGELGEYGVPVHLAHANRPLPPRSRGRPCLNGVTLDRGMGVT